MAYQKIDWYETPRYYDLIFDTDTGREADFLEAVYMRYSLGAGGRRRVLEPACGSGRLLREMARRGWETIGIDQSEAMLSFAERSLPSRFASQVELIHGDMSNFRLRRKCDLAHCLVSSFKYLLSEDQARHHLHCVGESLRIGGIYVLGFHLSDYDARSRSQERWVAQDGNMQVVCNITGWPADRKLRRERVRSRLIIEQKGQPPKRSETEWEFRTYDSHQAEDLFSHVPELELVAIHDFHHDLRLTLELHDDRLDKVFVFRRRKEVDSNQSQRTGAATQRRARRKAS